MEAKVISTIDIRENRSGEPRAYITGTRTRVQEVYVLSEIQGLTPEGIISELPHLTLGQIHAALSYFWDHQEEIRKELADDRAFVAEARRILGHGPLETKLKGRDVDADHLPS